MNPSKSKAQDVTQKTPECLERLEESFDRVFSGRNTFHREYLLIKEAKQWDISLDEYRKVFESYCRDTPKHGWFRIWMTEFAEKNLWDYLQLGMQLVIGISVPVVIFVGSQYFTTQANNLKTQEDKRERTLKMYEVTYLEESALAKDIRDLDKILMQKNEEIIKALKPDKTNKDFYDYVKGSLYAGNEDKILNVGNFYVTVQKCVENDVCDKRLAEQLFMERGEIFRQLFEEFFKETRYTGVASDYNMNAKNFYNYPRLKEFRNANAAKWERKLQSHQALD